MLTSTDPDTSAKLAASLHQAAEHRHEKNKDAFAAKTDQGSAELYFHYYGMLMHQQNMLQDYVRTGTYYAAIVENAADFQGKLVMDVGAGSGILSLFSAQVGRKSSFRWKSGPWSIATLAATNVS